MTVSLLERSADWRRADVTRAGWTQADTVAVAAVVLAGGLLRLVGILTPGGVFDEGYYTHDACWYVHGSSSLCGVAVESNPQHPPGGKWLIAFGIRLFGYNAGGWRVSALAAGTVTIALLYLLARKLFHSTRLATLTAALLSLDFLHFVHSRIAMLEVFVTFFAVAMFLCHVYDREALGTDDPPVEQHWTQRVISHRWRVAAGLAGGAAVAVKWSALPIAMAVIALTLGVELGRRKRDGEAVPLRRTFREEWPSITLCLVVVPTLVYLASYAGTLSGSIWAWPWAEGSWLRQWVERQAEMLAFHHSIGGLGQENPYTSAAWSWPLLKRPIVYFFEETGDHFRFIMALGNPAVWWAGLASLTVAGGTWVRRANPWSAGTERLPDRRGRRTGGPEATILAGFAAVWVPWLLASSTRDYMFLFYFLPSVPFLCLAVAYGLVRLPGRLVSAACGAVLACSLALFGFYYPMLTAVAISPRSWEARVLFDACERVVPPSPAEPAGAGTLDVQQEGRSLPFLRPGPPPRGWCWR